MKKTATRVARSVTFTFDTEDEKAAMHAHAKRRGLTLAGLIKMLLAEDARAHASHTSSAPGPNGG